MNNMNKKKSEQLGMSYGKANNILRKSIMFSLVQKLGYDICYRCGEKIGSIDKLSIEHISPWLDSDYPVDKFFDLNNIAFSHLSCNCKIKRVNKFQVSKRLKEYHKIKNSDDLSYCPKCKLRKSKEEFTKNNRTITGCEWVCKECRKIYRNM